MYYKIEVLLNCSAASEQLPKARPVVSGTTGSPWTEVHFHGAYEFHAMFGNKIQEE